MGSVYFLGDNCDLRGNFLGYFGTIATSLHTPIPGLQSEGV